MLASGCAAGDGDHHGGAGRSWQERLVPPAWRIWSTFFGGKIRCLFRLHEGSIKKEDIVEFLKVFKAHLKQPPLVIWDG